MNDRPGPGRASERRPVGLHVRLAFGDLDEFVDRFATNISDGGIFIRTRDPRQVGTRLSFELRLRTGEVAFSGTGIVRWVQGLDARGLGTPGMGIAFDELTDETRAVLAQILRLRDEQELPPAIDPAMPSSWRPLEEFPEPEVTPPIREAEPPPVMVPVRQPVAEKPGVRPSPSPMTPPPGVAFARIRPDGLLLPEAHNARPQGVAAFGLPQTSSKQLSGVPPSESAGTGGGASSGTATMPVPGARESAPSKMPRKRSLSVGLDIGWSGIRVAIASGGIPRQIPLEKGGAFPAVAAAGQNGPLFGSAALEALDAGAVAVRGLAGLAGLWTSSPAAREWNRRLRTEVVDAGGGSAGFLLGNEVFGAERLLTGMLEEVRSRVENLLQADIERAVLTVPTFLSEPRRRALRSAADAASFRVEQVVDSSLAAVLGCHGPRGKRRVLAVDVGGGSSSASVVEQSGHVLELVSEASLPDFGGLELTMAVLESVLRHFEDESGANVLADEVAFHRVLTACDQAKAALSDTLDVEIAVPSVVEVGLGRADLHQRLTRARLLQIWGGLLERVADLAADAAFQRKHVAAGLDEIVLLGMQTRNGALARTISARLGRETLRPSFAAEAAALGAALLAEPERGVGRYVLVGTAGSSLSLGLSGGGVRRLVERDSSLPVERSFMVPLTGQIAELFLFQGEAAGARDCEYVGVLQVGPLESAAGGERQVSITLELNEEGGLDCRAIEPRSGASVPVVLSAARTRDEALAALMQPAA